MTPRLSRTIWKAWGGTRPDSIPCLFVAARSHKRAVVASQHRSQQLKIALDRARRTAWNKPNAGENHVPKKASLSKGAFNPSPNLPFELRVIDFEHAMEDVYDFFADVNELLLKKGLHRLDDMMRPAAMSGMISDMITAALAKFSRSLVENRHFNGHPDLIMRGHYANDAIPSGSEGVEIKSTRKSGGAVDTHGARAQWMCVFVYEVDNLTQPATDRAPMRFTEVYLAKVEEADFRSNARGALGTRTATLHATGVAKLRQGWVYRMPSAKKPKGAKSKPLTPEQALKPATIKDPKATA